jgi:hypothetical protein
MIRPALHDVVERLYSDSEAGLPAGSLGTVIQEYSDGAFEVEFSDDDGRTLTTQALQRNEFIVVWRSGTEQEVPLSDQVAQIVELLPEGAGAEVLDFARYLSWRRTREAEFNPAM